mgnify:FL=1
MTSEQYRQRLKLTKKSNIMEKSRLNSLIEKIRISNVKTFQYNNIVYFSFLGKNYNMCYQFSDKGIKQLIAEDIMKHGVNVFYTNY